MKCPHCQVEVNVNFAEKYIGKYGNTFYSLFYMRCPNSECDKPIVLLGQANNANQYHDGTISIKEQHSCNFKQLFPVGSGRMPAAPEVESKFAEDYNEACLVLPFSPKASAALSRRILDVEPNEAEFLLDVLELLFDLYFVQAAKAAKMKAALNQKLTSAGQKPIP